MSREPKILDDPARSYNERIYELNQGMNAIWPPDAVYICSRCGKLGKLCKFKLEKEFGDPDLRQCLVCSTSPRPKPKPPQKSAKPKRPNRAAQLAAARIAYEDQEHYEASIKFLEDHPEAFGLTEDRS